MCRIQNDYCLMKQCCSRAFAKIKNKNFIFRTIKHIKCQCYSSIPVVKQAKYSRSTLLIHSFLILIYTLCLCMCCFTRIILLENNLLLEFLIARNFLFFIKYNNSFRIFSSLPSESIHIRNECMRIV